MREHRLYQADWLMRFYGFSLHDLTARRALRDAQRPTSIRSSPGRSSTARNSRSTSTAPVARCCCGCRDWAVRAVDRIIAARRRGSCGSTTWRDCRARSRGRGPFIVTLDWRPGALLDDAHLRRKLARKPQQLTLFGWTMYAVRMARDADETEFREAARRCISLRLSPRDVAFVARRSALVVPRACVSTQWSRRCRGITGRTCRRRR